MAVLRRGSPRATRTSPPGRVPSSTCYQGFYQGRRLRPATASCPTPSRPSGPRPLPPHCPGRARQSLVQVEHEYVRHGALALLAALDVHTGKVFAATPATAGVVSLMDLMSQVMSLPEYKDAPRVFVSSTTAQTTAARPPSGGWVTPAPNAIMIHTPVHASWLNQVEVVLSITQKKVISPNDFASLDELAGTLLAFVDRYNQAARPFNWKFTTEDLARLLDRISAHEHAAQNLAELPEAA